MITQFGDSRDVGPCGDAGPDPAKEKNVYHGGHTEVAEEILVRMNGQASVPRDVFPPTPPGPEGSNGNGLFRVQWVAGAWLFLSRRRDS